MTDDADVTFDGRRDERFETSWLVVIALPGKGKLQVTARDVSLSGARLSVPESVELPETFAFRIVGKDFIVQARKVWRRGTNVGITVERTAPLPVPPERAVKVKTLGPQARGTGPTVRSATSPVGYDNRSADLRELAAKINEERLAKEATEAGAPGSGSTRMYRDRPER